MDFSERKIPTKAKTIQKNQNIIEYCKKEIKDLIKKGLIWPNKSLWSYAAFYVQKNAGIKRRAPKLVINHKPLNEALRWIRYHLPKKNDLISRVIDAKVLSKFDLKLRFWQI